MKILLVGVLVLGALAPASFAAAEAPEVTAYNSGQALIQQGKLKQAIPPLEKAIEIKPSFSAPYLALGEVYAKRKLPSQGIFYTMRFVSMEPDGERSAAAAKRVFELLTLGIKEGGGGNITISMNPNADEGEDLGPIDLGRSLSAALINGDDAKGKSKAERYVSALKSFVNIADEQTQGGSKLSGILWKRAAAPVFELGQQGVLDAFLNLLASRAGFDGAEAWLKKNAAQKAKLDAVLSGTK